MSLFVCFWLHFRTSSLSPCDHSTARRFVSPKLVSVKWNNIYFVSVSYMKKMMLSLTSFNGLQCNGVASQLCHSSSTGLDCQFVKWPKCLLGKLPKTTLNLYIVKVLCFVCRHSVRWPINERIRAYPLAVTGERPVRTRRCKNKFKRANIHAMRSGQTAKSKSCLISRNERCLEDDRPSGQAIRMNRIHTAAQQHNTYCKVLALKYKKKCSSTG